MERIYAFTDESGSFGWNFDSETVSTYFIVSAIIVKESELENVRNQVEDVRAKCFQTGEMKSSSIGKNHSRRVFVLNELKKISFSVFSVICDKRKLLEINGLQYKESFYKYLNNDIEAINLYMGEYMNQYSWAEVTLANLYWKKELMK